MALTREQGWQLLCEWTPGEAGVVVPLRPGYGAGCPEVEPGRADPPVVVPGVPAGQVDAAGLTPDGVPEPNVVFGGQVGIVQRLDTVLEAADLLASFDAALADPEDALRQARRQAQ